MAYKAFTDGRRAVRLAVNGEISGRLIVTGQELVLRDVGAGGFLAETTTAIEVDSVHHVRLITAAGTSYVLAARCAHCRRRGVVAGAERFIVGFAFKMPNTAIDHMLDQLVGSAPHPPAYGSHIRDAAEDTPRMDNPPVNPDVATAFEHFDSNDFEITRVADGTLRSS